MKKIEKVGIAIGAIVLGLIFSPAVALTETEGTRHAVEYLETNSASDAIKHVRIVGLEEVSFAPNTININQGDTVVFTNVDGSNGGMDHTVISVKTGTRESNDIFNSGILNVGEIFKVTFQQSGNFEYLDSLQPTNPGRINVK